MKAPFPYNLIVPQKESTGNSGFNFKKAAGITLLVGVGAGLAYHFIKKSVKEKIATAADKKSFQTGSSQTNARLIRMALTNDNKGGTDVIKLRRILRNLKTQKDFDDAATSYAEIYTGRKLNGDLESELQTSEYQEMLAIKYGKPLKPGQKAPYLAQWQGWARRLKAAFEKKYYIFSGTDEEALLAVFYDIPTQKEFINTGATYKQEFGTNLITDLKSELEPYEYKDYMRIIGAKPKN